MSACTGCTRRQFLVLSAGAVVGACSSGSGGGGTTLGVGNVKDIAVGQTLTASDSSCVLMRDSGGLYALSLTCTHAGCNLAGGVSAQQIQCSCHGSVFGPNGQVLQGPAQDPLPHYAVTVDSAGAITVDTSKTVAADQRTAV
ncbi:MAG TPA: Rieske (2Fe-2S) protein [Myxococcales bacterium]